MTYMNFASVYQPKTLHWDFLFFTNFSKEYFLTSPSLKVSFVTITLSAGKGIVLNYQTAYYINQVCSLF